MREQGSRVTERVEVPSLARRLATISDRRTATLAFRSKGEDGFDGLRLKSGRKCMPSASISPTAWI